MFGVRSPGSALDGVTRHPALSQNPLNCGASSLLVQRSPLTVARKKFYLRDNYLSRRNR